jgi:O-antigen/teichoic acid export membrane protein
MSQSHRVVRGVAMNWLSLGFGMVLAFFLSPFVVHHLGNVVYGVWTLVISMISYMGLLDLGLRGAVTRYVSHHHAQSDHLSTNRIVSAVLWLRIWISLAVILIGFILAQIAPRHFHIPAELQGAARLAIAVASASFAITLIGGVFGGVLAALHRFDLLSTVAILQLAIRAVGIVWLLKTGHGIVALACWEWIVVTGVNLTQVVMAFRIYPHLRVLFEKPERILLSKIWGFSAYVFLIQISVQLMYYTDNLVVGAFVSTVGVTLFAIGGSLIEYQRQLVGSLVTTFLPLASKLEAAGEHQSLRNLLIQGTSVALAISLPIEAALLFRGPTFIGLWMGSQYAAESGRVLQILLLGQIFSVTTHTSANIAYGIGKPKPMVPWRVGEAVANVCLSVLLVRAIGIYGVAWGTVLPSLFVSFFFFPRFICRSVGLNVGAYLRGSWLRAGIAVAPFAIACYLTERFWHPAHLIQFCVQIMAILPIYIFSVALIFGKEIVAFLKSQDLLPARLSWLWQPFLSSEKRPSTSELQS